MRLPRGRTPARKQTTRPSRALASKKGSLKVGYRAKGIIQNSWKLFYLETILEREFPKYKAKKFGNILKNVQPRIDICRM